MTAGNGSKLRCREFPKGHGIRIREIVDRTGGTVFNGSFIVSIPARLTLPGAEAVQVEARCREKGG